MTIYVRSIFYSILLAHVKLNKKLSARVNSHSFHFICINQFTSVP